MSYKNLGSFIKKLEKENQLIRISTPVSSYLEITEITDRVSKSYGPALLFENVKDSDFPVLINAMGTYERMSMALGVKNLDDIGNEIEEFMNMSNYMSIKGLFKSIPRLTRMASVLPLKLKVKGQCQQVVHMDPDLTKIPVLQCWPKDGGPFVTLPLVFTKDPETRIQNIGMYRLQIFDKNTTGMHWHLHKDGREIYDHYKKNGGKMPISVALGCDPAITYAATAPLPKMIDEMMFAGWLRKMPVKMVKSITNDIYVPAGAEFIIEGYVDVNENLKWEGPFGDHTGYYSLADYYPAFHVTCITHKKNAIYPTTIVGKPPMEDCYMGKATERIFLPLMKMMNPEIIDVNFPLEGVFHSCVIVSIKKRFPGHARKIMNSLWGMGQMMYTKMIIVVDDDINPQDPLSVAKIALKNVEAQRDIFVNEGSLDALDHASSTPYYGSRIGIDATTKLPSEVESNKIQPPVKVDDLNTETDFTIIEDFVKCHQNIMNINYPIPDGNRSILILSIKKDDLYTSKSIVDSIWKLDHASIIKLIILVDENIDTSDLSAVAWKAFNNIDAKRDLHVHTSDFGSRLSLDATKKLPTEGHNREWPEDIEMSDEIKKLVTNRWDEYGIK